MLDQELQIKQEPKDEQIQPKIKQEPENEFGDKDDNFLLPKLYWNFEEQGGERGTLNGERGAKIVPREDPSVFHHSRRIMIKMINSHEDKDHSSRFQYSFQCYI